MPSRFSPDGKHRPARVNHEDVGLNTVEEVLKFVVCWTMSASVKVVARILGLSVEEVLAVFGLLREHSVRLKTMPLS